MKFIEMFKNDNEREVKKLARHCYYVLKDYKDLYM